MDRKMQAVQTMDELGIREEELAAFPEFAQVKDRLVYGQVWAGSPLDEKRRFLVWIACLVTVEGDDLADAMRAALKRGVDPAALQEVFHQAAPYIGIAKAQKGLSVLRGVFEYEGTRLPLPTQGTVTENDRLEKGIASQKSLFGPHIDAMRANAPENQAAVQDYLSAYCFGDTYTRGGIDLQTRELLTFVCIACLGGCDPQARAHAGANLGAGNDEDTLIAAVSVCLPYIGFPRTLNAIAAITDAAETSKGN